MVCRVNPQNNNCQDIETGGGRGSRLYWDWWLEYQREVGKRCVLWDVNLSTKSSPPSLCPDSPAREVYFYHPDIVQCLFGEGQIACFYFHRTSRNRREQGVLLSRFETVVRREENECSLWEFPFSFYDDFLGVL